MITWYYIVLILPPTLIILETHPLSIIIDFLIIIVNTLEFIFNLKKEPYINLLIHTIIQLFDLLTLIPYILFLDIFSKTFDKNEYFFYFFL